MHTYTCECIMSVCVQQPGVMFAVLAVGRGGRGGDMLSAFMYNCVCV